MFISETGEFGLINHINEFIRKENLPGDSVWHDIVIGIGDDAAVMQSCNNMQIATIDCLVENIHFKMDTATWEDIGWKALAVNLSDIAAMGGQPRYALISLTLPRSLLLENIIELYRGIILIANQYHVAIVGGNISSSSLLTVHVTLLGSSIENRLLTRSSAKPGDVIGLTGYTGLSASGLKMLTENIHLDSSAESILKQAHLRPQPRVKEGQSLVRAGIVTAIDISDGLLADLRHICDASKVSAIIHEASMPLHPSLNAVFKKECMDIALGGGEDYELLFTGTSETVLKAANTIQCPITVIGEIISQSTEPVTVLTGDGQSKKPVHTGWNHLLQHRIVHD